MKYGRTAEERRVETGIEGRRELRGKAVSHLLPFIISSSDNSSMFTHRHTFMAQ